MQSEGPFFLINLCVALIVGNIVFLGGILETGNASGCTAVAVLLHYFLLAAFFVILAEGIRLYMFFSCELSLKKKFESAVFAFTAWFIPAVVVAVSMGSTQLKGYGTKHYCWLSPSKGVIYAFFVPVILVCVVNVILLFVPNIGCRSRCHTASIWNMGVLTPLLGVTWLFGYLTVSNNYVFRYGFTVCNCLAGTIILIYHGIYKLRLVIHSKMSAGGEPTEQPPVAHTTASRQLSDLARAQPSNTRSQNVYDRLQPREATPQGNPPAYEEFTSQPTHVTSDRNEISTDNTDFNSEVSRDEDPANIYLEPRSSPNREGDDDSPVSNVPVPDHNVSNSNQNTNTSIPNQANLSSDETPEPAVYMIPIPDPIPDTTETLRSSEYPRPVDQSASVVQDQGEGQAQGHVYQSLTRTPSLTDAHIYL